jgi:hypothetical protein
MRLNFCSCFVLIARRGVSVHKYMKDAYTLLTSYIPIPAPALDVTFKFILQRARYEYSEVHKYHNEHIPKEVSFALFLCTQG